MRTSSSFRFLLVQTVGSSYECLAVGRVTALLTQHLDVIAKAAIDCVKSRLGSNLVGDICLLEVRPDLVLARPIFDPYSQKNPFLSTTS